MTPLAAYVLSLAFTMGLGTKVHSLEALPECGTDAKAPTCELRPVCDEATILCAAPRWEPRWEPFTRQGAWVRVESKEAAARRLEVAAQALADAAEHAGAGWKRGPQDLARVMLAASAWSTGLREDIQVGRMRGPAGEVCLVDVQIATLRQWLPYDLKDLPEAELLPRVAGRDYPTLRRCFDAGMVGSIRSAREAERRCSKATIPNPLVKGARVPLPFERALFAIYGTGSLCFTPAPLDWAEVRRFNTLERFRAQQHTVFPDWYRPSA